MVAASVLVAACSSASEEPSAQAGAKTTMALSPEPEDVPSLPDPADVENAWNDVVVTQNAFAASELSISGDEIVGVLADAQSLKIMQFDGAAFIEVTATAELDIPSNDRPWDITIQSEQITGDGALDFVINFGFSPLTDPTGMNYGRDWGTVISGDGGTWKSLTFSDPYNEDDYTSLEHIEVTEGNLLGDWYGSMGRGTLTYTWDETRGQLVGVDATPAQIKTLQRPYCASWEYNENLPITPCQEGVGVTYIQNSLLYVDDLYSAIEPDGYFGRGTEYAIKYFQSIVGLRSTGIVDLDTWKALIGGMILPGTDLNGDGVITPNELSGT
jgi:hypothetical protein